MKEKEQHPSRLLFMEGPPFEMGDKSGGPVELEIVYGIPCTSVYIGKDKTEKQVKHIAPILGLCLSQGGKHIGIEMRIQDAHVLGNAITRCADIVTSQIIGEEKN